MGTGTGFAPPRFVNSPIGLQLSLERNFCDFGGNADAQGLSSTPTGLYDLDGDGQPEVVDMNFNTRSLDVYQLKPPVDQVDVGPVASVPAAGRLVKIDNGYGAITRIGYQSAKEDPRSHHNVPSPEIVVTAEATTDAADARLASTTRYAYHGAGLIFDSAYDAFVFPGYQRTVELRATSNDTPDGIVATITDAYGLAPFDPNMDAAARFTRYLKVGRVSDVTVLSGRLGTDPWLLAIGDISTNIFRKSGVHHDWDARLLPPGPASAGNEQCLDMMFPYDFAQSQANRLSAADDACTKHGFVFQTTVSAWRGTPGTANPFTVDDTVKTKMDVHAVDDFGRTTSIALLNDSTRSDDDLCVQTVYATPTGTDEHVLSAPASRTLLSSCDPATAATLATESWEYDTSPTGERLPAGKVSAGRLTSQIVSRRNAETGTPILDAIGSSDIRVFDATYDPTSGALASVKTTRDDGATRTVTTTYDSFALAPVTVKTDATNADGTTLPSLQTTLTRDPLTLDIKSTTDPNGTQRGNTYDGFGRVLLLTITSAGGTTGALSSMSYVGFGTDESGGRRVVQKVFTDPVTLATVGTAAGRTGTTFLDALGRVTHTEAALGADYANQTLILGQRLYDQLGRVQFEADPHPSTESIDTAYGTSRFFNMDGTFWCVIRGNGPQVLTLATDEANERYPTCFHRLFANHRAVVAAQDAASLLAGSAQAGIVHESTYSAIGQLLERTTYKPDAATGNHINLEDTQFGYDRLGHLIRMVRAHDPSSTTTVATTWHFDSLGQVLELDEPDSAPQFRSYTTWGELVLTQWNDTTTSPASERRLLNRYDALGRLVHREERTNQVVDAATVHDFVYDQAVHGATPPVTATNVVARLAKATSPTSSVSFSYDAFGRSNAQVFIDRTTTSANVYVQKHTFHGDGSLQALDFLLPDTGFKDERVDYVYDSAGRLRTATYSDGTGGAGQSLFNIDTIDPFGRTRHARIGLPAFNDPASYAATYADTGRRLLQSVQITSATETASREIAYPAIPGTEASITAYDPLGRERVRRETVSGAAGTPNLSTYDALGRLEATAFVSHNEDGVPVASKQWQFGYDLLGNILTKTDLVSNPAGSRSVTLSYQSTDRDRLCSIGYGSAAPSTACDVKYDGVGNIIEQQSRSNGPRTFEYFADGQVKKIAEGNGTVANFRYDAFGAVQQLDLTGNTPDTRHDRHFGGLIMVRDETTDGGATTPVITRTAPGPGFSATRHGPAGPWIFALGEQRGNRYFIAAGESVQEVKYEPYGEATSTGQLPRVAQYSSEQWNGGDALAAFGLVHLGARLYDPVIGRFLSRDPLLILRTAATHNPYAFASNDPVNRSDPTGLQERNDPTGPLQFDPPCLFFCGGGGAGGGGGGGSGGGGSSRPDPKPQGPHFSTTGDAGNLRLDLDQIGSPWSPRTLAGNPLFTPLRDNSGDFVLSSTGRVLFGSFLQTKYGKHPNFDRISFRIVSSLPGNLEAGRTESRNGSDFVIGLNRNGFSAWPTNLDKLGVIVHELVHVLQRMRSDSFDDRASREYHGLDFTSFESIAANYAVPDEAKYLIDQRSGVDPADASFTLDQNAEIGRLAFIQEMRAQGEFIGGVANATAPIVVPVVSVLQRPGLGMFFGTWP